MRTIRTTWALLALVLLVALSGCGSGDSEETTAELQVSRVVVESEAVGRNLEVSVIEPNGGGERPLLVFLHGAGGSNESSIGNRAVLDTLAELGEEAPVVAFPNGEESWWHDRASGEWGRYVVEEVIPVLNKRLRTDPRRVAIGGISMGGYGAYHLGLTYPDRFCAVGGHSAGLWLDASEEFPGAFDNRADYEANDVLAAVEADPDAFGPTPVWNDYGDQDWFVPGNAAFVTALESSTTTPLTAHVWPGGHDAAYWDTHFPQYLRFYAKELANC